MFQTERNVQCHCFLKFSVHIKMFQKHYLGNKKPTFLASNTEQNHAAILESSKINDLFQNQQIYSRRFFKTSRNVLFLLRKLPWNFSFFYFNPGNSRQNKNQPLDIPQNCVSQIPWKCQGQKQRPMQIPHYFFLVTLGNSTSFLIKPQKFHLLFL